MKPLEKTIIRFYLKPHSWVVGAKQNCRGYFSTLKLLVTEKTPETPRA